MKNVDLIHGGWLYAPNGASSVMRSFYENVKMFKEYGVCLRFFTLDRPGDKFSPESNYKGSKLKRKVKATILNLSQHISLFSLINIYITYMRHARKVVKLYIGQSQKSNVVFIHDIFTAYYYSKLCNKKLQQKVVLILHNNGDTWNMLRIYFPVLFKSPFYGLFKKIEKKALCCASKIGFVADACRLKFNELHPEYKERSFYIHNGILDFQFDNNGKLVDSSYKYRLCCTGTLSERKGQLRLVEAYKNLPLEIRTKIHITLLGDGSIRGQIENLINEYELQDNILLVGSTNKVLEYLNKCNIYILPSNDEGLPISIIEAMRASLGIISTKIAGIPELVDNQVNGVLIQPDIESIEDVLLKLNKYDWTEMGKMSRSKFEKDFTINSMIEKYSLVLLSV